MPSPKDSAFSLFLTWVSQSLIKNLSLPKRCKKSAVRIPPHPALSPGIGGEGKGEGEIRDEDGIHRR